MRAKEILQGLGGFLISILVLLVIGAIACIFIFVSAWVSSKLLPWFSVLTVIGLCLVVFVFLPLAIPKATRGFSSVSLLLTSYIFGATLWMEGLLLTLSIWGVGAVIIGLFIAGVGVVPIAMLATLFKGMWWALLELILLTIMTFSCRIGALNLAASLDSTRELI